MVDAETRRIGESETVSEAPEVGHFMTNLFGEQIHEGRIDRKSKRQAMRRPQRGSHDWPEPEPIATELGPTQPYPAECLGNLRPVLEVINKRTGVGIAVAAASVIPSVALLAQMDYRTLTLGPEAPLGVYMLGLVSSGGRKTSSHRLALGAHLEADELLLARYVAALESQNDRSTRGGIEGGPPRLPRREPPNSLYADVTKTALIKALGHGRPALCLAASDAGVVMGNWSGRGQQQVETFQTLAALWDGNEHTLSRVNLGFRLKGQTLSVAWLAQPPFSDWLLGHKGEMGLSSRFLVCQDDHWTAPAITDEEIEALVAAEADNQGTPPVDPVLGQFWDVIADERRRQVRAWSIWRVLNAPSRNSRL